MIFTSPAFLVFFAGVCLLNFFLRPRARTLLLLLASLVFVASFNLVSLAVLILFTSFNFVFGLLLAEQKRPGLFTASVLVNCLVIVLNNYFISVNGRILFSPGSVEFQEGSVLFVIGLSFYSLQHIAYLTDVHSRRIAPETNYVNFLLISCYFPKLISGPITLYQKLKAQLPIAKPIPPVMWQGFNRMLLGFFKKMVIADRLAPSVASVFDYNDALPGVTIMTAGVFFTLQLYFDFSGYCDIAIGASKLLGIELPENFNFPLRSGSITVFWRRWHQSLIGFLTTYVYYPIAFRYRKLKRQAAVIGIMVTFFISALWHGIGFTFLAWACCHIIYLLAELYLRKNTAAKQKNSIIKSSGAALFVLALVAFSNLFFRASSGENARRLMSDLFSIPHFFPGNWTAGFLAPLAVGGHQLEHFNLFATLFFTTVMLLFERRIFALASSTGFKARLTFIVLLLIFIFGVFSSVQRFIYMQF